MGRRKLSGHPCPCPIRPSNSTHAPRLCSHPAGGLPFHPLHPGCPLLPLCKLYGKCPRPLAQGASNPVAATAAIAPDCARRHASFLQAH